MRLDSNYVRLHIVHELEKAPFASIRYDDFDVIVVDLPNRRAAAVCIMERPTPLGDILAMYLDHMKKKIHTVYLLWCDMLVPNAGEIFEPPDWLLALHTLHNQKIYAYKTVGDEVEIFPVYFKRIGEGVERLVKYGSPIHITDIGCAFIDVKGSKIAGRWRMADFATGRGKNRIYTARMDDEQRRRAQEQRREHQAPPLVTPANPMLVYYRELGIAEGSNWDVIKKAYRDLARQYHPDKNPSRSATERMQQINAAYAHLMKFFDDNSAA